MKRVWAQRLGIAAALLLAVLVVGLPSGWVLREVYREREARVRYSEQQHALFAAETGVEAARIFVEEVCADPARRTELLETAATQEISMPGQEGSLKEFFGYTLPGDGSVVVRLRGLVGPAKPDGLLVRSAGRAGREEQVLIVELACPAPTH